MPLRGAIKANIGGSIRAIIDSLATYNHKRPHQGRNMNGRTPYKVFMVGLPKARKSAANQVSKAA